jgi:hypothetical protein
MSPADVALALIDMALRILGPALVRQRVDEWEAARAAADAAFAAKFGETP